MSEPQDRRQDGTATSAAPSAAVGTGGPRRPAEDVEVIEALVREAGGRLAHTEVASRARVAFANPTLPQALVDDLLAQSRVLHIVGTDVACPDTLEAPPTPRRAPSGVLRAVAVDLETIAVQITTQPYVRAVPYQLGAVRFGTDVSWVQAHDPVRCWMQVDDDVLTLVDSPQRREAIASAPPAEAAAAQLRAILEGADSLVAYNGTELDFPVIEALLGGAVPGVALVDGLYLAHALWPQRSGVAGHGLFPLAREVEVGVDLDDADGAITAHDALADSIVLVRLLEAAARKCAQLSDDERVVLRAATAGSAAWRALLLLAGIDPEARADTHEVRAASLRLFSALAPVRDIFDGSPLPPVGRFAVDPTLRPQGRTDPGRLVSVIRGREAQTRATQAQMLDALRGVHAGHQALIEAPTGTGKSAAMLAAAFDHLLASPDNRVIISTYTRQLQRQLGEDLQALCTSGLLPDLDDALDLVKGGRNRLSLRALGAAVSDLAAHDASSRRRRHDPRRRELVAYLLRRLLENLTNDQTRLLDIWDARSVDPADLPGLFEELCAGRLEAWLDELSQGRAGDHAPRVDEPVTLRTRLAREALASSRLAIANHALLLRANDVLAGGEESETQEVDQHTLVLLDEAHSLEDAATAAIEAAVDAEQLEAVVTDAAALRDAIGDTHAQHGPIATAVHHLDALLSEAAVPRAVGALVELSPAGTRASRSTTSRATVAAAGADSLTLQLAHTLHTALCELLGWLDALRLATSELEVHRMRDRPRIETRLARLHHTRTTLQSIADDLAALCGVAPEDEDTDPTPRAGPGHARRPEHDPANRVVWVETASSPGLATHGWRHLRFRVVSSPIDLGEEPSWQRFRRLRPCTAFISGTLRVPGARDPWQFIRDRLGLDEHVATVALPSPFDPARQALLVAFEDFPSWVEQPEAARRTIGHHLHGYARELIRPRDNGEEAAGHDHGAMVLTTSRADAAAIADLLLRSHAGRLDAPRVHPAVVLGNATAVTRFRGTGGLLVGTRGLWQGVDIDDADRLSLVWITKLPFASPDDPVLEQRMARAREQAVAAGAGDPDLAAMELRSLPMAAIDLRQAVGRLLRTTEHRGVVVISDRRLAGTTVQRRAYRRLLLGSLDEGYLDPDADDGDPGSGNLATMHEGWRRIVTFLASHDLLDPDRAARLCRDEQLESFVWLEETRRIRSQTMSPAEVDHARRAGTLEDELLGRAAVVGGALTLQRGPIQLRDKQVEALRAIARGDDVLAVLPTGYGKSFVFQLPALILPGLTLVLSPLVSLMTDQALNLNRTVGGAVRALVGPMQESVSRRGMAELATQLTNPEVDHGIRLVYLSPERLVQRHLREQILQAVRAGTVRRIAVDEAHTFAQWGSDFRPQIRRAEAFVRELHAEVPALQIIAVTATATPGVLEHLRRAVFGQNDLAGDSRPADFVEVSANPIRHDLAVYRRRLTARRTEDVEAETHAALERVLRHVRGHVIVYAMTVPQVTSIHRFLKQRFGSRRTVMRYHGKLSTVEKTAAIDAFVTAPREEQEGFRPMVVVATTAFGLGIDRPDIRAVVVASPPTDLAGLYQQLGRAGRDQRSRPAAQVAHTPVMALLTQRGWETLQFFLRATPETETTLRDLGERLLAVDGEVLDTTDLAATLVDEAHADGRLSDDQRRDDNIIDAYRVMILRVFALMAATGHLEDHGDFPEVVRLRPGAVHDDALAQALLTAARGEIEVEMLTLWQRLPAQMRDDLGDVGACFAEMMLLHADGHLDVSRMSSRGYRELTGFRRLRTTLDPALPGQALQRLRSGEVELERVRAWFEPDGATCANAALGRYFSFDDVPEGTCATPANRCSSCWQRPEHAHEPRPDTYPAFFSPAPLPPEPAIAVEHAPARMGLEESICALLRTYPQGLGSNAVLAVLRGERSFQAGATTYKLFAVLRTSVSHGSHPEATLAQVQAALANLNEQELVGFDPTRGRWRPADNLDAEAR